MTHSVKNKKTAVLYVRDLLEYLSNPVSITIMSREKSGAYSVDTVIIEESADIVTDQSSGVSQTTSNKEPDGLSQKEKDAEGERIRYALREF